VKGWVFALAAAAAGRLAACRADDAIGPGRKGRNGGPMAPVVSEVSAVVAPRWPLTQVLQRLLTIWKVSKPFEGSLGLLQFNG